jgi:hypothetical protein
MWVSHCRGVPPPDRVPSCPVIGSIHRPAAWRLFGLGLPDRLHLCRMLHVEDMFVGHVHSLRGLAILWVVLGQVGEAEGWNNSRVLLEKLLCALIGRSTVPFMFASGFLFQHQILVPVLQKPRE